MRTLGQRAAAFAAVALLGGCVGDDRSESEGSDGPLPSTIVGFSPADLTTDVQPDAELTVLLTNAGGPLPPLEELESVVELVTVDGTPVDGDVTSGPSTDTHAVALRYRAAEPLVDGWYELRFTDRFDAHFRVDDRVASQPMPGDFIARLRVGSQPFLRAVTLCLAGTERLPVVRVEFSEPVVDTAGEGVEVRNEDGSVACTLAVEAASEYPGLECPSLDPAGDLTIEVPTTIESLAGIALQRGPNGGAPPSSYLVDRSTSDRTGCRRYPLVPADSLGAATAAR